MFPGLQSLRGVESASLLSWDSLCADTRIQKVRNPETRPLVSESGLWFRNGINGKLSRAKISHAVKHTCLSGVGMQVCWEITRATMLCHLENSCQWLCCVPASWREGEIPCWKVTWQLPNTSFLHWNLKVRSPSSNFPLAKAHFGCCKKYTKYLPCVALSPGWGSCDVYASPWLIYSCLTHRHCGPTYITWEMESTQHLSAFVPLTTHSAGGAAIMPSYVVPSHTAINTVTLRNSDTQRQAVPCAPVSFAMAKRILRAHWFKPWRSLGVSRLRQGPGICGAF